MDASGNSVMRVAQDEHRHATQVRQEHVKHCMVCIVDPPRCQVGQRLAAHETRTRNQIDLLGPAIDVQQDSIF